MFNNKILFMFSVCSSFNSKKEKRILGQSLCEKIEPNRHWPSKLVRRPAAVPAESTETYVTLQEVPQPHTAFDSGEREIYNTI